jgi:DNA/RNA endonuclease YhcR with UshA esterase domain
MTRRAAVLLVLFMAAAAQAADPPVVPLAEAGKHVDKEVTVQFVVQSARLLESGKFCFLNSKKNFTDQDNFTAAIDAEALAKFAENGVKDPSEHFQGQTIRVTGKVSLHREKPQIIVEKPGQIVIVVMLKGK